MEPVVIPIPTDLSLCNKCGNKVEPGNSAVELMWRAGLFTWIEYLLVQQRHLLRSDTCEGSPSLAQYLEGQPLDTRIFSNGDPMYPIVEERVETIRFAYRDMQLDLVID